MKGAIYECTTLEGVKEATEKLDKAVEGPILFVDGGINKEVKNFKGIYNINKGQFCAAVVPHYNLIQHKEYFDAFATALSRLNIKYTAELKTSGHQAFIDFKFINKNVKFDTLNEEFTTGLRLVNSYNKSTGVYVMPRYTRLACTNGMILSRTEKAVSIKHHTKMMKEIDAFVERRVSELINTHQDLQLMVSESMKDSIEWSVACKILHKLFEEEKHKEQVIKKLGISMITVTDKKTKKKTYSFVWDDEKNKKKKFTRWEIYNAITSYITHGEQITPFMESSFHKKAEKLLITPLVKMPLLKVTI